MRETWVLTGTGLITAAGDTPQDLFAAMTRGLPLVTYAGGDLVRDLAQAGAPAGAGAEGTDLDFPVVPIRRFDPKNYMKRKGLKDLSRTSQLACTAASRLAERLSSVPGSAIGVSFGSAWGSLKTVVDFERAAHVDGPRFVDPLLFTETVANVPASQIAIFFGWSAVNGTLSAATASGLEAIRWALDMLEEGRARVVVAGGGDELDLPLLRSLYAQHVTADIKESLPFGQDRCGSIGGEGACLLTVEAEPYARERDTLPLARILATAGGFCAGDGRSLPSFRRSAVDLMRGLLEAAQLSPNEIDLLVLSGSGSVAADREEALAAIDVFGSGAAAPPAAAPKGVTGETWGASGPIGVATALEAIRTGTVPGRARGTIVDRELSGLNLPAESYGRTINTVMVFDGSASGHLSGIVLSALWSAHGR